MFACMELAKRKLGGGDSKFELLTGVDLCERMLNFMKIR